MPDIEVSETGDVDTVNGPAEEEEEEEEEEEMVKDEEPVLEQAPPKEVVTTGTILEAAFCDPAMSWPPPEGQGKNAIELQASTKILENDDDSFATTASMREAMKLPKKPKGYTKTTTKTTTSRGFWCCKSSNEDVVISQDHDEMREYETMKQAALVAREEHKAQKKKRERERKQKQKYSRVPEGILIYRLDTSTHIVSLVSGNTSSDVLKEMVVVKAGPSHDKTRRGISLEGPNGEQATLVACEQRTAISWLEAMDMMLGNRKRVDAANAANAKGKKVVKQQESRMWGDGKDQKQRDEIEQQYVHLADYSNKLIRAGALPGQKKGGGGTGGIYYSVETMADEGDDYEEEKLESIAKRRAVIKDSWDFYRMICSLLRDRRKYDEVFRKLQHDPVYPYLNSMTGLNDPGDDGYENSDKPVVQTDMPEYAHMSKTELARTMVKKAEEALPSLVEICKALAGSLGMEEVGVGPVKDVQAAIRKADKKYEGDLLKVTDYCRALLVVKDFPSLLALLELARDSFGPLIRRVKLSSLKSDHQPMPGGYRDCKINLELKGMVCEIQVHLWPMWVVCGVDGFRHYRHCLEYSTDSFGDPFDALEGLDRKTMAELIVMAEEAVAETPLDNLEWYQEKVILDYFAEVGLFMKHGLDAWAEITLKQLIKLRTESPDIGPDHTETLILNKYLEKVLRAQHKDKEAEQVAERITYVEHKQRDEKQEAELSLWDSLVSGDALDMIMDPNKKEREEEEKLRKEVKASKKQWRRIRKERFAFLDANQSNQMEPSVNGSEGEGNSET